ncbi:DUF421 domain-containing protein [Alicyclobacillus fodiniaquatilis]|jgi:uncharacterized membrane protein YcaP (DUF421 family)|uniref:DUF421 domain-containing protein n=1 Tax=Alicyclobacillus fodiniaquatilis TaxID=1661150 RepID=A0ABW4JQ11_9BACL
MPDWINILIRSLVSFAAMFLFAKVIGKRQLSQISFFEYIVGIAIGDMAAIIADNIDGPIYHGLLTMFVYTVLPLFLSWLALKSKGARDFFEGKARVLIQDGKILEDNLKKERMSTDELLEHLRTRNAFKVADVEFALMEPSGSVNVLLKSENQPMTAKKMGWQVAPEVAPQTVIMDGNIIDESLATLGFNRAWLKGELQKQGVAIENVYLGQVDANGALYLDLFDDLVKVPEPQNLKLTYITLKKSQADLELYALSVEDEQVKKAYEREAKQLQKTIEQLKPLLTR